MMTRKKERKEMENGNLDTDSLLLFCHCRRCRCYCICIKVALEGMTCHRRLLNTTDVVKKFAFFLSILFQNNINKKKKKAKKKSLFFPSLNPSFRKITKKKTAFCLFPMHLSRIICLNTFPFFFFCSSVLYSR